MGEDNEFLVYLIFEIIDYAKDHKMIPDDTIRTIAESMLDLLEIATFNGGKDND